MELLQGTDIITKRISGYKKKALALDVESHLLACSTLAHSIQNSEYSLANKLVTALGRSQRKNALIRWFTTMGHCSFDTKTGKINHSKTSKGLGIEEAMEVRFWDLTKEEDVIRKFDLCVLLNSLITRCDERIEEAGSSDVVLNKTMIDGDMLKALRKLV